MAKECVVLGFDPGIATTGWAVVAGNRQQPLLVDCGSIETQADQPAPTRLQEIYQNVCELCQQFSPEQIIIEDLFFSTNAKTAIQVAQARGVILAACAQSTLSPEAITALNPRQLKQQLTGYGLATKNQIKYMVTNLFHLETSPQLDDVLDAIALAYTGLPAH